MISMIVATLGERVDEINRLLKSLEEQKNNQFELIVVSQDNHESIENILKKYKLNYKHIRIERKGLSLARNVGLNYANGDIITFSDDDCWYPTYAFEEINTVFKNNESDILCFNIFDPISNQMYKSYKTEINNNLSEIDLCRISSIEIFIDLRKVRKVDMNFDERFGLGARFNSGEENILLSDLKTKRYSIKYIPKIIVYHQCKKLKNKMNSEQAYCKGAMFKRMYPNIKGLIYSNLLIMKNLRITEEKIKSLINVNIGFFKFHI